VIKEKNTFFNKKMAKKTKCKDTKLFEIRRRLRSLSTKIYYLSQSINSNIYLQKNKDGISDATPKD